MIVVTNRIPVSKGHEIDFEDRFRRRVHLVDRSPGFVRGANPAPGWVGAPMNDFGATPMEPNLSSALVLNEVHRPRLLKFDHEHGGWIEDPEAQGYYEVKTWWRTFDDFVAWTKSPSFAEAHSSRPPKEMFAGPNVLEVHEILTSTDLDLG